MRGSEEVIDQSRQAAEGALRPHHNAVESRMGVLLGLGVLVLAVLEAKA
jgi:hypothetical protein